MAGLQHGIGHKIQAKQLGRDLSRDIVRRRAETAGNENQVRPLEVLLSVHRESPAHRAPTIWRSTRKPSGKISRAMKREMSVDHVAEQNLGAGVDDDDAHCGRREQTFNVQRSTSNVSTSEKSVAERRCLEFERSTLSVGR